ncbi:radical SAM protein [Candidatus Shapirobacteria bacterium]|nr:radical SAM protein [Candidatus Shapirobacteria bacterium]
MLTKINELQAKTILTKSGLPGADWVINPYRGCQMGCMYCYAAQIARWKHPSEEWGSYLDIKINAPELLKKELTNLETKNKSKDFGFIFFSSVTDPYTPLEAKYHLTRSCLQVLSDFGYEGKIGIQTKSPLVLKDIDILKLLKNVQVGFTVTTLDDKVSRFLEVSAPPVSERIRALKELSRRGVPTYAFIGPLLPHFMNSKADINHLLDTLQDAGVAEVWFEHINLSSKIKARLFEYLETESPNLIPEFEKADNQEYRDKFNQVIYECLEGRNLKLGLGKVIFHHDLPQKK